MEGLKLCCTAFLLIICVASCARTTETKKWKDDNYNNKIQKVFLLAATQEKSLRSMTENVFETRFRELGLQAFPSHETIPQLGDEPNSELILREALTLGADSLLLVRSVGHDVVNSNTFGTIHYETVFTSNENFTFYGQGFVRTGVEEDSDLFHVQADLFDIETKKKVWSSVTDVWIADTIEGSVRPFVDAVMEELEDSRIIAR